jgi:hypothetical protein
LYCNEQESDICLTCLAQSTPHCNFDQGYSTIEGVIRQTTKQPINMKKEERKPTPYFVVWCNEVNSYKKFRQNWDCFYNYEDAKKKYDKLYDKSVENLKLTKVIEEKEIGVQQQKYYI